MSTYSVGWSGGPSLKIAGWSKENDAESFSGADSLLKAAAATTDATFTAPGLTDPIAANQWHLGKLGGIAKLWEEYTGKGIKVGVYDSGIDTRVAEIAANYDASNEVVVDGVRYNGTYRPIAGPHGTAVAGLIAAARDGEGTVGIAYDAKITGINIFDPYSGGKLDPGIFINVEDQTRFLSAFAQGNKFDITNHSWGGEPSHFPTANRALEGSRAALLIDALESTAATGRGGLGTIAVKAAGNYGTILNNDPTPYGVDGEGESVSTDRHWISVAAYREADGFASAYSARGAQLLISAPSSDYRNVGGTGIWSSDAKGYEGYNLTSDPGGDLDYTDDFGGTSAATPITSGVIALMLDANDQLGWRDVKDILAASATLPVAFDTGPVSTTIETNGRPLTVSFNEDRFKVTGAEAGSVNGGGHHYSTDYGYGALNAFNAVRMAEVWSLFGTAKTSANEVVSSTSVAFNTPVVLPEFVFNPETGNSSVKTTPTVFKINVTEDVNIEHLDVFFSYSTPEAFLNYTRAFDIIVTSPTGVSYNVSMASEPSNFGPGKNGPGTEVIGLAGFRGETSVGEWTVTFTDPVLDFQSIMNSIKLNLFGAAVTNDDLYSYTDEFFTMAAVAGESGRTMLVDRDGGIDWINAATVTSDVVLNLAGNGGGASFGDQKAFAIGRGTVIENAVTGDGNDALTGNSTANKLYGMRGSDKLFGLGGDDLLDGGAANDWLDGGKGNDVLTGGAGNDVFFFDNKGTSGFDRITDFSKGDRLLVNRALRDGNGDGIITFGKDGVLNLDASSRGDRVQLDGVDPASGLKFVGMNDGYYVYVLNDATAGLHG